MRKCYPIYNSYSHLMFLAVDPSAQNNGLGTHLLTEIINHCEKERRPIYYETTVESMVQWLEKFEFKICCTTKLNTTHYVLRSTKRKASHTPR
jgi:ribosomal protein S18 acetylase RimI-like enzyme